MLDLCKNLGQKTHLHWPWHCFFPLSLLQCERGISQSLCTPDDRTTLLVFQCSVSSSRSLMVATAGWHCKQPSHLSVNRRADVSATESLPPSSATWSPSSIHHSPCCLYRETPCRLHKAYSKGAERNVHHLNASRKPSGALFDTRVLRSKQF